METSIPAIEFLAWYGEFPDHYGIVPWYGMGFVGAVLFFWTLSFYIHSTKSKRFRVSCALLPVVFMPLGPAAFLLGYFCAAAHVLKTIVENERR